MVNINGHHVEVHESRYQADNTPALVFIEPGDGQPFGSKPFGIATVCVAPVKVKDDEIVIKNWSENAGYLNALLAADILQQPHRTIPCGYTEAHVCRRGKNYDTEVFIHDDIE